MTYIYYEETLIIKPQVVQNLVNKTLNKKIEVKKTIGMGNPYNYRNKVMMPFTVNKDGDVIYGFYEKKSHRIVSINQ